MELNKKYKVYKYKFAIVLMLFAISFVIHLINVEKRITGVSDILAIILMGMLVRYYYKMEMLKMQFDITKMAQQGVAPEPVLYQKEGEMHHGPAR